MNGFLRRAPANFLVFVGIMAISLMPAMFIVMLLGISISITAFSYLFLLATFALFIFALWTAWIGEDYTPR